MPSLRTKNLGHKIAQNQKSHKIRPKTQKKAFKAYYLLLISNVIQPPGQMLKPFEPSQTSKTLQSDFYNNPIK